MTPAGQPDGTATQTQEPGSCLSPWQRDNLADGLLAIGNAIASDPEAQAHSLNHWLTWLDEEGYDPDGLMEALTALGQHHLTAEAWQQLQAEARASAEAPNGIDGAAKHLDQHHPALLEEILTIQQTRQQQLETLQTRAGGVNWKKVGKTGGEAVGGVLFGAMILGIGYKIHKKWEADVEKRFLAQLKDPVLQSKFNKDIARKLEADEFKMTGDPFLDAERLYSYFPHDTLVSDGLHKLPMPLESVSPLELMKQADSLSTKFAYAAGHYDKNPYAAELQAKILRVRQPELYLKKLNEWIINKEDMAFKVAAHDAHDALVETKKEAMSAKSEFYKDINEAPRELREEFHGSTFMRKELADGNILTNGRLNFFKQLVFKDILKTLETNQNILKEALANGKPIDSLDKLNNYIEFDFTDTGIRSAFRKNGEDAFEHYYAIYTGEAVNKKRLAEDSDSYLDKIIVDRNPFVAEARKILDNPNLEKSLSRQLKKQLNSLSQQELPKLLDNAFRKDRAEFMLEIKNTADNALKNKLEDELDDPLRFFDKTVDKNINRFDRLVESEVCKSFHDALAAAKGSLQKAEREGGDAARAADDIL